MLKNQHIWDAQLPTIKELQDQEENSVTDLDPEGITEYTDRAFLLRFGKKDIWFPKSVLRQRDGILYCFTKVAKEKLK